MTLSCEQSEVPRTLRGEVPRLLWGEVEEPLEGRSFREQPDIHSLSLTIVHYER